MRLQPIVYVTDMAAASSWYGQLLATEPEVAGEHWTSFRVAGGHLALHLTEQAEQTGAVELSLVVDEPLESTAARMGYTEPMVDEAFGRSIRLDDPDGRRVQVNEHTAP